MRAASYHNRLFTVKQFCDDISHDTIGFVDQILSIGRNVSPNEREAMIASYPQVSAMLTQAMKFQPELGNAHISTTSDLLLEYKLPGASSWCDLVLLGKKNGEYKVIIIELKNWDKKSKDTPGKFEGFINHDGKEEKHPSDQVKGYTEYCRYFHSTVLETPAQVQGLVYFTQPIPLEPYRKSPNQWLTVEYPLFNKETTQALAEKVISEIEEGDEEFAAKFVNGYYRQNRNIIEQIAKCLSDASETERPFVLLDEQRRGFNMVMGRLDERVESISSDKDSKKEVIIVYGPPGSGKSAVAVNLWIEAARRYPKKMHGDIVYVTTSASQKDNWQATFGKYGKKFKADAAVIPASEFLPITLNDIEALKIHFAEEFRTETGSLKIERFKDYCDYAISFRGIADDGSETRFNNKVRNYSPNHYFLSVVDEAHALRNPLDPSYIASGPGCHWAGPEAYHIIQQSQVSVFLMDDDQSFRDKETTSIADIKNIADQLGAEVTEISLDELQFRCAGSKEYVDWVKALFTSKPLKNHAEWAENFQIDVVDYPSDMEAMLRERLTDTPASTARILSSYTQKWESGKKGATLQPVHSSDSERIPFDFVLADKGGQVWRRYWNNKGNNTIFVQAKEGSTMSEDPLSEVGCPVIVRGFDYDHVGVLMLDDIFVRDNKWYINFNNIEEVGVRNTLADAKKEQIAKNGKSVNLNSVEARVEGYPATEQLFDTVRQAYRILLTRGIKSIVLYVRDPKTRQFIKNQLQ